MVKPRNEFYFKYNCLAKMTVATHLVHVLLCVMVTAQTPNPCYKPYESMFKGETVSFIACRQYSSWCTLPSCFGEACPKNKVYVSKHSCGNRRWIVVCANMTKEDLCCSSYYGELCKEKCPGLESGNVCSGKGVCHDGREGSGKCICQGNFAGKSCETCKEGYYGDNCDKKCMCYKGRSICQRDGACLCFANFRGKHCQNTINICKVASFCKTNEICSMVPIKNGGTRPVCTCKKHYVKHGSICVKIDPCAKNYGGCDGLSTKCFANSTNQAECRCLDKFIRTNRSSCVLDSCIAGKHECHTNSKCQHVAVNISKCVCNANFSGNGTVCIAKDFVTALKYHDDTAGKTHLMVTLLTMFAKELSNISNVTLLVPYDSDLQKVLSERKILKLSFKLYVLLDLIIPANIDCHKLVNNTIYRTAAGRNLRNIRTKGIQSGQLQSENMNLTFEVINIKSMRGYVNIVSGWKEGRTKTPHKITHYRTVAEYLTGSNSRLREFVNSVNLPELLRNVKTVFLPTTFDMEPNEKAHLKKSPYKMKRVVEAHLSTESITRFDLLRRDYIQMKSNTRFSVVINETGFVIVDNNSTIHGPQTKMAQGIIIHFISRILIPPDIKPILRRVCTTKQNHYLITRCIPCQGLPCKPGYKVSRHSKCGSRNERCSYRCVKTTTKVECCHGFWGANCTNMCPGGSANPCSGHGMCDREHGGCSCPAGVTGSACELCESSATYGLNCTRECLCIKGVCDSGTRGTGHCLGACKAGYDGVDCDKTVRRCRGVQCHAHAHCAVRRLGHTYRCVCNRGYEGSGQYKCTPINWCEKNNWRLVSKCSIQSTCKYVGPGQVKCLCKTGYEGDGRSCVRTRPCGFVRQVSTNPSFIHDVDVRNRSTCGENQYCKSIFKRGKIEKMVCSCMPGYVSHEKEPTHCAEFNRCAKGKVKCSFFGKCVMYGKNPCECMRGFRGNGTACYAPFSKISAYLEILTFWRFLRRRVLKNNKYPPGSTYLIPVRRRYDWPYQTLRDGVTSKTLVLNKAPRNYTIETNDDFQITVAITKNLGSYYINGIRVLHANIRSTQGDVIHLLENVFRPTREKIEKCVFPFVYDQRTFYSCTMYRHKSPWCSLDAVYAKRWMKCNDTKVGKNQECFERNLKEKYSGNARLTTYGDACMKRTNGALCSEKMTDGFGCLRYNKQTYPCFRPYCNPEQGLHEGPSSFGVLSINQSCPEGFLSIKKNLFGVKRITTIVCVLKIAGSTAYNRLPFGRYCVFKVKKSLCPKNFAATGFHVIQSKFTKNQYAPSIEPDEVSHGIDLDYESSRTKRYYFLCCGKKIDTSWVNPQPMNVFGYKTNLCYSTLAQNSTLHHHRNRVSGQIYAAQMYMDPGAAVQNPRSFPQYTCLIKPSGRCPTNCKSNHICGHSPNDATAKCKKCSLMCDIGASCKTAQNGEFHPVVSKKILCTCPADKIQVGRVCATDPCKDTVCPSGNHCKKGALTANASDAEMWPIGNFALPMPVMGCPNGFEMGWRVQHSEYNRNGNIRNSSLPLAGGINSGQPIVEWGFCVNKNKGKNATWPKGSYCVYKVGQECPTDFKEGKIKMHDDWVHGSLNHKWGSMPSGTFDTNTTFRYCCREDGNVSTAVILPSFMDFFLFPNADGCQQVFDMEVTSHIVKVDTEDNVPNSHTRGDYPKGITLSTFRNVFFKFCHYRAKTPISYYCECDKGTIRYRNSCHGRVEDVLDQYKHSKAFSGIYADCFYTSQLFPISFDSEIHKLLLFVPPEIDARCSEIRRYVVIRSKTTKLASDFHTEYHFKNLADEKVIIIVTNSSHATFNGIPIGLMDIPATDGNINFISFPLTPKDTPKVAAAFDENDFFKNTGRRNVYYAVFGLFLCALIVYVAYTVYTNVRRWQNRRLTQAKTDNLNYIRNPAFGATEDTFDPPSESGDEIVANEEVIENV